MFDVAVIGAGIVGLATARELLLRTPGRRVVVLEKAAAPATAQTGHNSGVIHAGLYYTPGSLKARLCRAGERETKQFCTAHGIRYETIGKLVVATDVVELERMWALGERAVRNGIVIEEIPARRLRELEPHIRGVGALLSPATGIVNFREVAAAMARDIRARGGEVRFRAPVMAIAESDGAVVVRTPQGQVEAGALVACAGLQADRVARLGGLQVDVRIIPFRGEYFELPTSRAGLVHRLVYPVPDPDLPFLGVHLSPTIDGRITVGPNAVLGLAREGYPKGSINLRDAWDILSFRGLVPLARENLVSGARELFNSLVPAGYLRAVRKYAPELTRADLRPHAAGIRAQAMRRDGSLVEDFHIERTARQLHVLNAPSPAATSAIPIGREIAAMLDGAAPPA